jgi:hypothetical protein
LFVERRHSLPLCTSGNYCVDSDEYDVLVEWYWNGTIKVTGDKLSQCQWFLPHSKQLHPLQRQAL